MKNRKWLAQAVGCLLFVSEFASLAFGAEDKDKAQAAYKTNCVSCHGSDGAGTPLGKSMQAADLRSEQVQSKSDTELGQVIHDGKNNMPGFKNTLDAAQIEGVVKFIRELGKNKSSEK
jgi:mono/diheme cytochrome c family protein